MANIRTRERSSAEIYIDELKKNECQALNQNEEFDLLEKASKGDKKAQEKIIKANLRYVISVAKKFASYGTDIEDLIQTGNLALYESFLSFNFKSFKKRGCHRFISYAGLRIAQQIVREIRNSYSVSMTESRFKTLRKLQIALNAIDECLPEDERIELAGKEIGLSKQKSIELFNASKESSSMEFSTADDDKTFGESIIDERMLSTEDQAIYNIELDFLNENLCYLDSLEIQVLTLVYGLDGEKPLNFSAVGKAIGYTREGVRLVHNRAINQLRSLMNLAA